MRNKRKNDIERFDNQEFREEPRLQRKKIWAQNGAKKQISKDTG